MSGTGNPVYIKHERISLRGHPQLNEQWLQDRIAEDPSILGLGDLVLIDRERRQEGAGRLDLLFTDDEGSQRFEVEVMLGATNESHIIRCIEYWDIERRRYPGYDHVAVLVAEDITSRFLNILGLFAGTIPLVAIQLSCLKLGDNILLDTVKVIDQRLLRVDDTVEATAAATDRAYWEAKSGRDAIGLADELLAVVNATGVSMQLNYNKHYIGLSDGIRSRNFVVFQPRKKYVRCLVQVGNASEWADRVEEAGLAADVGKRGKLRVNVSRADLQEHDEMLRELLQQAVGEQQG